MPCNCGKGKSKVTSGSNFSQNSPNIKRQPVTRIQPPATKQNNVTTAGVPVIKRAMRSMPLGVRRVVPRRIPPIRK